MQAARMLIRAGRLEHARVFLEQARPSDEEESIERLFLLGRIEVQLGMPSRAIERFETILARRPELTRVRLELAQAYYLTGHDDKAKRHFNSSLADELPSSVEAAVESFLRGIDARKKWSVSLSASMLPETSRSDREEVLIGGVPFRLDEDARASSGVGVLFSTGASYSPTITDDIRGVLAASAAAKLLRAFGLERRLDFRRHRTHTSVRQRRRVGRPAPGAALDRGRSLPVQPRPLGTGALSALRRDSPRSRVERRVPDAR